MMDIKVMNCTDESWKDETFLQLKMKKNYIKTWKISRESIMIYIYVFQKVISYWWNNLHIEGYFIFIEG